MAALGVDRCEGKLTVGLLHHDGVMRSANDCDAPLACHASEEDGNDEGVRLIEARGWLVHEEERWLDGQRSGHGYSGLLAARESGDALTTSVGETDCGERLRRARGLGFEASHRARELEVFDRAQEPDQAGCLPDNSHVLPSEGGARFPIERSQRTPEDPHLACRR